MNKLIAFLMESKQEFNRINWPTSKETINLTLIVILLSVGLAFFLGAVDFGLGYLLQNYLL